MLRKLSTCFAALICVTLFAALAKAQAPDPSKRSIPSNGFGITSNSSSVVPSNLQIPAGPACKTEAGSSTCRWDNIQVESVNTRLVRMGPNSWNMFIIKGKDKEIRLIYMQSSNPAVIGSVGSCEKMAISALEGLGRLSFYVVSSGEASATIEAGFQSNVVPLTVDTTPPTFFELGCFLTPST